MNVIVLENVGKRFKDNWVLKDISLTFEKGKIHGLVGRNGSGKTMIMRLIAGLSRPTCGKVTVLDKVVGVDVDIPESLGAIIEVPGFLPNLSAYRNFEYLAGLRGVIRKEEIKAAIKIVGLDPDDRKPVGKYSLGMRQRLGIAQAIMEDPDIIILDEPMNGLDIQGVQDIKEVLKSLRKVGKTIILASHHMEDIDELCDTVTRLDQGRIIGNLE